MGAMPRTTSRRGSETSIKDPPGNPYRRQMIAVSTAGALCGAAIATALLLIVQTAVFHSACGLGPSAGLDTSAGPALPATPPEPPNGPT